MGAEIEDDFDALLTEAVRLRHAGEPERADALITRSIALNLAATLDADALREALTERAALGTTGDGVDEHARVALERLERQGDGAPIAAPWYPAEEYALALQRLPGFAIDWHVYDHATYSRELDRRLRDVVGVHGHTPLIVPVRVEDFLTFAEQTGLEPEWAETRARHADARRDEALAWPPGRNETCWCGADEKYKRHCGT